MNGLILCVDIGSSALKAACIDRDGRETAFVRRPYARTRRQGIGAADWEDALSRALGSLFRASSPAPEALCISGAGPTLVPLAYTGETLPPVHWYHPPARRPGGASLFLPYAADFMRERPEDYSRTRYLFSVQEWLCHRLGAEPVTALPAPSYEPYYWDEGQCRAAHLDKAKFPPLVTMGTVIGRVSAGAARRFSLPEGLPIVAGGPDFIMALIGTGVLEPGAVCDRAGSSEGINVCAAGEIVPDSGLRVLPHITEGLWNVGALIPASGQLFEWFRSFTGQAGESYEAVMEEIAGVPAGTPDAVSAAGISPPFFFPAAGFFAPGELPGRARFGRAVVEAIGFQVCAALEALKLRGFAAGEMRLSGGQGRSRLWNQLKADMTGVIILTPEIIDGELAGDAALAAAALEGEDLARTVSRMVRIRDRYVPDPEAAERYRERYGAYRELYEKAKTVLGIGG